MPRVCGRCTTSQLVSPSGAADDWVRGNSARQPAPRHTVTSRTLSLSSICCKPLLFNAGTQTKALIASGRDLVAFLLVCGDTTDIRHEHTGFSWDVGADVP